MNLRISENCLRFRLQAHELAALLRDRQIHQTIQMGGPAKLQTSIHLEELPENRISAGLALAVTQNLDVQNWRLSLSPSAAQALSQDSVGKDGIEDLQNNPDGSLLKLVIEIDIKPKRG